MVKYMVKYSNKQINLANYEFVLSVTHIHFLWGEFADLLNKYTFIPDRMLTQTDIYYSSLLFMHCEYFILQTI